jgi:pilus assembly protein Flp/PilA
MQMTKTLLPSRIFIARFAQDGRGATAIEYGLIIAGISMVVAAATSTLGTSLVALFQKIIDIFA